MTHIFANWKMYLDVVESRVLGETLVDTWKTHDNINCVVFPTPLAAVDVTEICEGTPVSVGAQNVAWVPRGAYTGASSAMLYKNIGCTYALVGHSERRYIFGERNIDVRKKTEACLEQNIIPVICIGESQKDRDNGKEEYRIKKQIMRVFDGLNIGDSKIFVAYEPVWAVGTGIPCDPDEAEKMHIYIKEQIAEFTDVQVPILYGGSVNADNVTGYASSSHIDGMLVGSASVKIEEFSRIIEAVAS